MNFPFLALTVLLIFGQARAAEHLRCGVIIEPLDWNKTDLHGNLSPLDREICQAVTVARSGSADQLDIHSYDSEEDGLRALQAGQADLIAGLTPDAGAAKRYGVRFSVPFFYDAQGFMVHRAEGVHSIAGITGRKLCYTEDTDNAGIVLPYLASRGIQPVPFGFQEESEMDAAIMDRRCEVTSAMLSKLAEARAGFRNKQDYVFLSELIDLAPVTVGTNATNQRLSAITDMTISALLQAELLQVTQADAAGIRSSDDPRMRRLLGEDHSTAAALDLPHDWSRKVVEAVGNYSEIYERAAGPRTELDLPRGFNALWNKGGLMTPLPLH